jgi:hypothetical protein
MHSRGPDCKIDVLPNPPGEDYVQIGDMDLGGYVMFKSQYQYKSPYLLAADMRPQICAIGGDTLVTERDAAGVITRGIVYRHLNNSDIPAPYKTPPVKPESCEGACRPGFRCEHDVCVPVAVECDPTCNDGETCGPDGLCHPAEPAAEPPAASPAEPPAASPAEPPAAPAAAPPAASPQ